MNFILNLSKLAGFTFLWHILRTITIYSTPNNKEYFYDLLCVNYNMDNKYLTIRNNCHSILGILFQSSSICIFVTTIYDTNINYIFYSNYLILSSSYFISDLIVIKDFPIYKLHHVITIILCTTVTFNNYYAETYSIFGCKFLGMLEIAGLTLNLYLIYKDYWITYFIFIIMYSATRLYVAHMVYDSIVKNPNDKMHFFTTCIVIQNFWFLYQHLKKLPYKWKTGKSIFYKIKDN